VFCSDSFFSFSPDTRTWARVATMPAGATGLTTALPFDEGTVFWMGTAPRILISWNRPAAVDFLMERKLNPIFDNPHLKKLLGTPRWDWPQQFPLERSLIIEENGMIWVLAPRKSWSRAKPDPV